MAHAPLHIDRRSPRTVLSQASLGALAALLALTFACATRDNLKTCTSDKPGDCATGTRCNVVTYTCEPDDAAVDGPRDLGSDSGDAVGVDAPVADAASDLTPDVPGSCGAESDCASLPDRPHCLAGVCVACATSSDCTVAGAPICAPDHTCQSCLADAGAPLCADPQKCDPASGRCVGCLDNATCLAANPQAPLCSADKTCVACNGTGAPADGCKADSLHPVCGPDGACVACNTSTDCADPASSICDAHTCRACKADKECVDRNGPDDPGVCLLDRGGQCATTAEVLYVKNAAGCVMADPDGGSLAKPFCRPENALAAVTAMKRVIVMRGPDVFTPLTVAASGAPIIVIGQAGATVSPGAYDGISVTSGELHVRGLTVTGGAATGISVASGATVVLDRCLVVNNAHGGLLVNDGAGFDVANTVFDGNGVGMVGAATFGGAYLGTPGAGLSARFRASTIVNNKAVGVACAVKGQALSSLLLSGNQTAQSLNCTLTSSNATDPPLFDPARPYHLTMSSPCVDHGDMSDFPADDLDGDLRPSGAASDCGADEYVASP